MNGRFDMFRPLFDVFRAAGHQLYIVGGCVRDVVMGLDHVGDVDLATDAHPDETRAVLDAAGYRSFLIGERFGTITTLVGDAVAEITTFRVGEIYEPGSRHPRVEFGHDLEADLSRRDLSMNAMAMDVDGRIIDPFDGHGSIRDRLLEVPGGGYENTLSILRDDPLRLLRIARFAARFGFAPTNDTTAAARETAPDLVHISHERWKMEMDKLLVGDEMTTGLRWLHDVGGLTVVLPIAAALDADGIEPVAERIRACPPDSVTRWATLIAACLIAANDDHSDTGAVANGLATRFRFSNRERKSLAARLALLPSPSADTADHWSDADLRRLYVTAPRDVFEQLTVAAVVARDRRSTDAIKRASDRLHALVAKADPTPVLPPRFGAKLARRLGLAGAEIGEAITRVRDAILDGALPNGADADTYLDFLDTGESTD